MQCTYLFCCCCCCWHHHQETALAAAVDDALLPVFSIPVAAGVSNRSTPYTFTPVIYSRARHKPISSCQHPVGQGCSSRYPHSLITLLGYVSKARCLCCVMRLCSVTRLVHEAVSAACQFNSRYVCCCCHSCSSSSMLGT
jgi:hypothetical protein